MTMRKGFADRFSGLPHRRVRQRPKPEPTRRPITVPDAVVLGTAGGIEVRWLATPGARYYRLRLIGDGETPLERWKNGEDLDTVKGTKYVLTDTSLVGQILSIMPIGTTGRLGDEPREVLLEGNAATILSGTWRVPTDLNLTLYWSLDEWKDPATAELLDVREQVASAVPAPHPGAADRERRRRWCQSKEMNHGRVCNEAGTGAPDFPEPVKPGVSNACMDHLPLNPGPGFSPEGQSTMCVDPRLAEVGIAEDRIFVHPTAWKNPLGMTGVDVSEDFTWACWNQPRTQDTFDAADEDRGTALANSDELGGIIGGNMFPLLGRCAFVRDPAEFGKGPTNEFSGEYTASQWLRLGGTPIDGRFYDWEPIYGRTWGVAFAYCPEMGAGRAIEAVEDMGGGKLIHPVLGEQVQNPGETGFGWIHWWDTKAEGAMVLFWPWDFLDGFLNEFSGFADGPLAKMQFVGVTVSPALPIDQAWLDAHPDADKSLLGKPYLANFTAYAGFADDVLYQLGTIRHAKPTLDHRSHLEHGPLWSGILGETLVNVSLTPDNITEVDVQAHLDSHNAYDREIVGQVFNRGRFDEIRCYDRALTPVEMLGLYNLPQVQKRSENLLETARRRSA